MRDLEFIRGFPGFPGNDVVTRCSEPPFPTHGGQDDGSYTNSLKLTCIYLDIYLVIGLINTLYQLSCIPNISITSAGEVDREFFYI